MLMLAASNGLRPTSPTSLKQCALVYVSRVTTRKGREMTAMAAVSAATCSGWLASRQARTSPRQNSEKNPPCIGSSRWYLAAL